MDRTPEQKRAFIAGALTTEQVNRLDRESFTFNISGKAMLSMEGSELSNSPENYDGGSVGACDAYAALNSAQGRRAGKGRSYRVTTTREGADCILDYCLMVGETFAGGDDPETRADGRALLKVAAQITMLLDPQS